MFATTIPVTVAEDAAERVAQLGMQREFEIDADPTRRAAAVAAVRAAFP